MSAITRSSPSPSDEQALSRTNNNQAGRIGLLRRRKRVAMVYLAAAELHLGLECGFLIQWARTGHGDRLWGLQPDNIRESIQEPQMKMAHSGRYASAASSSSSISGTLGFTSCVTSSSKGFFILNPTDTSLVLDLCPTLICRAWKGSSV